MYPAHIRNVWLRRAVVILLALAMFPLAPIYALVAGLAKLVEHLWLSWSRHVPHALRDAWHGQGSWKLRFP